jgi:hypothetical protein
MQTPGANVLPFLIIIPLVAWRMYSRVKRSIGRQTLSKLRPWFTVSLFPLLIILFAWNAMQVAQPALLWALAGGIGVGVVLGVYGLRHTKFESTPQGMFYTPNAHIGIVISLLFLGRVLYRMFGMYTGDPYSQQNTASFALTPLTFGIFGVMAGYYVTYAVGLIRWRMSVENLANSPTAT